MSDQRSDLPIGDFIDLTGKKLGERYELLGRIGTGGMAIVYEARRIGLHKRFAVKVLKSELATDPSNVRRFLREARAASLIVHENVVDIVDVGETDQGPVYFVMEFLEGYDLRHVVKHRGAQPWPWCRRILLQVVPALGAAHAKGIVHRDVKPANVFLVTSGRPPGHELVKVVDFGIAKVVEEAGGMSRGNTMTNGILGTVAYMAPEQAYGVKIDARTDVYALGVVWYQMMTGRVPFSGGNPFMVLGQHVNEPPTPPRDLAPTIPHEVEAAILKCLEKDPDKRYQTMEELRLALLDIDDHGAADIVVPRQAPESAPMASALHGTSAPVRSASGALVPRSRTQPMLAEPPRQTASYSPFEAPAGGPMSWAGGSAAVVHSPSASSHDPTIQGPAVPPTPPHVTAVPSSETSASPGPALVPPTTSQTNRLPIVIGLLFGLGGAALATWTLFAPPASAPNEPRPNASDAAEPRAESIPLESAEPDPPALEATPSSPPADPLPIEPPGAPAIAPEEPRASDPPANEPAPPKPRSRSRRKPKRPPTQAEPTPAPATPRPRPEEPPPPTRPVPKVHPDLKNPYD